MHHNLNKIIDDYNFSVYSNCHTQLKAYLPELLITLLTNRGFVGSGFTTSENIVIGGNNVCNGTKLMFKRETFYWKQFGSFISPDLKYFAGFAYFHPLSA